MQKLILYALILTIDLLTSFWWGKVPYCGSVIRHTLILENYVFKTLLDVRQCDRKVHLLTVLWKGIAFVEKSIRATI